MDIETNTTFVTSMPVPVSLSAAMDTEDQTIISIWNRIWFYMTTFMLQNVTLLLVTFVIYLISKRRWVFCCSLKQLPIAKRVLFLTAHPDDEVMFFGPSLIHMIKHTKAQVYLLCLSSGDYEYNSSLRQKELWDCCKHLGMSLSNITMLRYGELKDDPKMEWSIDLLARIVENHVRSYDIDMVITFDGKGVSGHKNHVACFKAVNKLFAQPKPPNVRVFVLDSVNIFRKYYLNMFDVIFSYRHSAYLYVVSQKQRSDIVAGMKCHESQLNWYRRLYLIFSRYIFMNTLKELRVPSPTMKKPKFV